MGILDHLTCLLRNLYAGQEATVRTGHGELEEQGREARSGRFAAAISSASGLWIFCRASHSAMLRQSIRRFTTSVIRRSHYKEGPGKNIPFSVENKWRLLAMMTLFFGSGFAAPFFIVRHQLLKK